VVLVVRPEPEPVTVAVTDPVHLPSKEGVMSFCLEKQEVFQVTLDVVVAKVDHREESATSVTVTATGSGSGSNGRLSGYVGADTPAVP
jgi:hypothetical protein